MTEQLRGELGEPKTITLDPHTNVFPKCPRCKGGRLILRFESYREEGGGYVVMFFVCNSCNAKFVLIQPFVEWGWEDD